MGKLCLPDQEGRMRRHMETDYRVGSQKWEGDFSRAITSYNFTGNHVHCSLGLVSLGATYYIDDNMSVAL